MITFLTVLGIVLGYFAVGAVYARSQSVRLYKVAKENWRYEDMTRETLGWMIAWRIPFWPWAIVQDAIRGPLRRWFMSPIDDRKERAEQLRKDAEHWRDEARYEVDGEKKAAYEELARVLRERAREVDL